MWSLAMARSRYRFLESTHPHFMTCTVVGWLPVFTRPECVRIVLDSWKFLHDNDRMSILGYVILENHLHFIGVSADLSKEVGDFKSFTARRIIDLLKKNGETGVLKQLQFEKNAHKVDRDFQLWQEGSHPKKMENHEMLRQKLQYIHYNPVKRGYVDKPEHWRYSSVRNYLKLEALVSVVTDWA
jgi:REP element-mobilizing transposase RayT